VFKDEIGITEKLGNKKEKRMTYEGNMKEIWHTIEKQIL
jgi:hypothetical protein